MHIHRSAPVLKRIEIPDPAIGATIITEVCLLAEAVGGPRIAFGGRVRDVLSLIFSATIVAQTKLAIRQ